VQPGPLAQFGPEALVTDLTQSATVRGTAITRLAGGGAVVVWASGSALMMERLDASGTVPGTAQQVGTLEADNQDYRTRFSIDATADGGWVIAWASSDTRSSVQFRRYGAMGNALGDTVVVPQTGSAEIMSVEVRAFADGGFVIGWISRSDFQDASAAFVRRFAADGTSIGSNVEVGEAGDKRSLQLAILPGDKILAAWLYWTIQPGGASQTLDVRTQKLDSALNPVGGAQTVIADMPFDYGVHLAAASQLDGRVALAWTSPNLSGLMWQVLDPDGVATGPVQSTQIFATHIIDTIDVVPASPGFTLIVESTISSSRGRSGSITSLAIDTVGAAIGRTELGDRLLQTTSPTTGEGCGPASSGVAAAGGTDGRVIIAYNSCGKAPGQEELDVLAR